MSHPRVWGPPWLPSRVALAPLFPFLLYPPPQLSATLLHQGQHKGLIWPLITAVGLGPRVPLPYVTVPDGLG